MESQLRLSEEHGSSSRYRNGGVSQVTFRPYTPEDFPRLCELFYQYWLVVNQQDTAHEIEINLGDHVVRMPSVEAIVHWYLTGGHEFLLLEYDGELLGFLLYLRPFRSVIIVRGLYLVPEFRGLGLVRGMHQALGDIPLRILFQTRKSNIPDRLLEATEKFRTQLDEENDLVTWEMYWRP